MDNISFRLLDFKSEDILKYKNLHNLLFPGMSISLEWINWYHMQLFHPRTYGTFINNSLVGIWSVEFRKSFISRSIIPIGRCFAVGVHPDYRQQGIFIALSKYALEHEKQLKQYEYIVGFPQIGRTAVKGHLKVGWYPVQDISSYSIDNKSIDKKAVDNFAVTPLVSFKELNLKINNNSFITDNFFRHSRWLCHPECAYIILKWKDISYIVLKPYQNICHVLEIEGDSNGVFYLLETAKKLCKTHNWAALTIWCAYNEIYREIIQKVGFIPNEEYMKSVKLIAYNINAKENLKFETCHFQTGVEELY